MEGAIAGRQDAAGGTRKHAEVRQALLNAPLTAVGAPTAVFDFDKTLTVRDTFPALADRAARAAADACGGACVAAVRPAGRVARRLGAGRHQSCDGPAVADGRGRGRRPGGGAQADAAGDLVRSRVQPLAGALAAWPCRAGCHRVVPAGGGGDGGGPVRRRCRRSGDWDRPGGGSRDADGAGCPGEIALGRTRPGGSGSGWSRAGRRGDGATATRPLTCRCLP